MIVAELEKDLIVMRPSDAAEDETCVASQTFDDARHSPHTGAALHVMPDLNALEGYFRLYHAMMYRAAYRITGSATDAEDAVQTIFLRLLNNSKENAALAHHTENYLRRAAMNAALDVVRARQRTDVITLDASPEAAVSTRALSPEVSIDSARQQQVCEAMELKEALRCAMAGLSRTSAEAFALRYFEGLTNGEIACALNTTPLVVGVMLHRARVRLQKDLAKFKES